MERVQSPVGSELDLGVPSLAPLEETNLEHLAHTARTVPGSAGRAALGQLHLALSGLAPSEANGALLVRLLDERAFDGLVAEDGSLTRELAVETLLRLGYPWALQLHPDELSWYRGLRSDRARNFRLMILLGILGVELATGLGLYLFL